MPAEIIARHLKSALGIDVGISFDDPSRPAEIMLYRPDRLAEDFVALAFQALEETAPQAIASVRTVTVAYDTPLGRSMRRVDFRSDGTAADPAAA